MIKNIIFDLGGVLLDVDNGLTYSRLSEVMGIQIDSSHIPAHHIKIMLGYEKGEINTETFLWNLQKESSKLTPQPDKLIKAWNAMLIGWNPNRFEFLEKLSKRYTLYLLNNTNDLHLEWVRKDLKKNHEIIDFDTRFFEKTFYSHMMRMRKPALRIYQTVIEETGINPNETLFIDDGKENVLKAKEAGFHAVLHNRDLEIIDIIEDYISRSNT